MIYLYSRRRLKEKILDSLPEPIKNNVMNTLDIYIEKGRKEGSKEKSIDVIESLIANLNLSDNKVATIAKVPVTFVKKVRSVKGKKAKLLNYPYHRIMWPEIEPGSVKYNVLCVLNDSIDRGRAKGIEEKRFDVVENLITKLDIPDDHIANIANTTVEFIKEVKVSLKEKQKALNAPKRYLMSLEELPYPIRKNIMSILDTYSEKGRKEGIEKGMEKKSFEVVENLITELGLSDKQAARIAEVPEAFVKKIRTSLRKKK